MVRILASTAEARHREVRGDLVIDLFLRRGLVWREIERLRERWAISPTEIVPPILPAGVTSMTPAVYRGQPWPERLPCRKQPNCEFVHHDGVFPAPWLFSRLEWRGKIPYRHCHWNLHCQYEWWSDLRELHDVIVPPDARREGTYGFHHVAQWMPFLSACLVFDPPREALLTFRYVPAIVYDLPPHQNYGADVRELPKDTPAMFAALIAPSETVTNQPVIVPRGSAQDIANAAKLLRSKPRSGRPKKRDRLTAVQCAVWCDQCGWSHSDIANHMGWELRADQIGKVRLSDRTQDHIKEGREIIESVRK
jgi:hypothetical protein